MAKVNNDKSLFGLSLLKLENTTSVRGKKKREIASKN